MPVIAYGPPCEINTSDPARNTIETVAGALGLTVSLEAAKVTRSNGSTLHYYRELRDGKPVLSGRADVALNQYGQVMRWGLRVHSGWAVTQAHLNSLQTAALSMEGQIKPAHWQVDSERSFAAWFPNHDSHQLIPVYWIRLEGSEPNERWEGIVHATTGEVLLDWPGIQTEVLSGTIQGPYWQPYIDSEVQIGVHPFEMVMVNGSEDTTNLNGQFSHEAGTTASLMTQLRGPYVEVSNEDAPNGELTLTLNAPFAPLVWEWTTADASDPELNLFHHTMLIHQWYKVLDPPYDALDYPMPAVANVGVGYDNAYWNGHGMYFGSGGQYSNFAMSSDVIYHEYTHGVTDGIYPNGTLPYTGQPGAMNEAWSDYFACTINGDPLMGEHLLPGSPNSVFRNLENNLVFPDNWQGEVHADSRFVSGALWRMRAQLGAQITDHVAHFARYELAETFLDYLVAVLETDDDDGDLSNGTPHNGVIYESFGIHGIGPGDDPHFAINDLNSYANGQGGSQGNGNRFIEQGEIVELIFRLTNDAPLYPPPATNVQITVTTADPNITIDNGTQTVASLPAGSSYQMTPVLLHINAAAPDHWAIIEVSVSANGGSATFHQSLEFTVGLPRVLIVKDDPVTQYEDFVTASLRTNDRIYDQLELSAGQSLAVDRLPTSGMAIWLSGNARGAILTAQDQSTIQNYLAAGNKIVLSGQNIVDNLDGSPFAQDILQVAIESDSLRSSAVTATGNPLTDGEWFLLTGTDGAANQREQSSFTPLGSSHSIAYYGRTVIGASAVVSFANENGLLFGFGIEAVSGMGSDDTDRGALLDELLRWAGIPAGGVSDPSQTLLSESFSLGPVYPNPFNSTTSIRYTIPSPLGGELRIFDVLGRMVESRLLMQSAGEIHWSPSVASGIFFAQIQWNGGQTKPIKIALLK
jgi:hypothetical protein